MAKILTLDGTESVGGRALTLVSALYWCADSLRNAQVRFIDVKDRNVGLAIDALRWDTGLAVSAQPDGEGLAESSLYAGIAFRSAPHMRLAEAKHHGVKVLLAIQFPDMAWLSAPVLTLSEAAFDPRKYAEHLVRAFGADQ